MIERSHEQAVLNLLPTSRHQNNTLTEFLTAISSSSGWSTSVEAYGTHRVCKYLNEAALKVSIFRHPIDNAVPFLNGGFHMVV
jgi:hypothetical protein